MSKSKYHSPESFLEPKVLQNRPEPDFSVSSPKPLQANSGISNTREASLSTTGPTVGVQRGTQSDEISKSPLPSVSGPQGSRLLGTPKENSDPSEYFLSTAGDGSKRPRGYKPQDGAVIGMDDPAVEKVDAPNPSSCCCSIPRKPSPAETEARHPEISNPRTYSLPGNPTIGVESEARHGQIPNPPVSPLPDDSMNGRPFYPESPRRPILTHLNKSKSPEHSAHAHVFPTFQFGDVPQTTVYSMPATYATAENPLTASQQEYFQRNAHVYTQQVPHYAPLGVIGSAAPPAEGSESLSLAHTCTCGPSCQCVFCVAHPYNAPTRVRVQSLAHLLPEDGVYDPETHLPSSYGSPFHSTADPNNIRSTTHRMHIEEILHPSDLTQPRGFSPSGYISQDYSGLPNSSLAETQQPSISSSGYLTMEYEFDPMQYERCTDSTGTCRCGSSCVCVGCLTHSGHDGETL